MNDRLCAENEACMFVTLICGLLNLESGEITLASGGHEPPLKLEEDGRCGYLEIEGGPALGLCRGVEYQNHRALLKPDSSLLIYTDGVTDATNAGGGQFGADRLLAEASRLVHRTPAALVAGVTKCVDNFTQASEQHDDITLLALTFGPTANV